MSRERGSKPYVPAGTVSKRPRRSKIAAAGVLVCCKRTDHAAAFAESAGLVTLSTGSVSGTDVESRALSRATPIAATFVSLRIAAAIGARGVESDTGRLGFSPAKGRRANQII